MSKQHKKQMGKSYVKGFEDGKNNIIDNLIKILKLIKMNEQERTKLTEEREKEICICECGFKPIKHFEECPNCKSCSYHTVLNKFTERKFLPKSI